MTRNDIISSSLLSSGGTTTKVLTELEESGFITSYIPCDKTSNEVVFRLTGEYSLFYLGFREKRLAAGTSTWLRISEGNSRKSWSS